MTVDWITEDALNQGRRPGTIHRNLMFELREGHPDVCCEDTAGRCLADAASWPDPRIGADLAYGWPA